ncbi:hypothetical protein AB0M10_33030 [Streptomyces sp. NPDC051840]|uniref:hypothetical protein n=1 Tax=Streptomyces sp. NPDC051840 TaxID=3154752 RepID=UPI0034299891
MNARKDLLRALSASLPLDEARTLVDRHHAEVVATHEAVAERGPFPMPAGDTEVPSRDLRPGAEAARRMIRDRQAIPTPGELAEQRHLMDPLDHVLEHLADERPAVTPPPGACEACGDTDTQWCPDCGACRKGCFDGHRGNDCTHANAPWPVSS